MLILPERETCPYCGAFMTRVDTEFEYAGDMIPDYFYECHNPRCITNKEVHLKGEQEE